MPLCDIIVEFKTIPENRLVNNILFMLRTIIVFFNCFGVLLFDNFPGMNISIYRDIQNISPVGLAQQVNIA